MWSDEAYFSVDGSVYAKIPTFGWKEIQKGLLQNDCDQKRFVFG